MLGNGRGRSTAEGCATGGGGMVIVYQAVDFAKSLAPNMPDTFWPLAASLGAVIVAGLGSLGWDMLKYGKSGDGDGGNRENLMRSRSDDPGTVSVVGGSIPKKKGRNK